MAQITEPIISIEGVATGGGGTATVRLTTGYRYHTLKLFTKVNGEPVAADSVIERVRVVINRKEIRSLPVSQILAINAFNKYPDQLGTLTFHFTEPWQNDTAAQLRTAWDTLNQQSFELSLAMKRQANVTDTVNVTGQQTYDAEHNWVLDKDGNPTGAIKPQWIVRQLGNTYNITANNYNINNDNLNQALCRVFFFAEDEFDEVELVADSRQMFKGTRDEADDFLRTWGMNPAAISGFAWVTDQFGRTEWLKATKNINFAIKSGAAQAADMVTEFLTDSFI
ncbi:hypothetical protein Ga0100231_005325 [Opitutaceae bacterium TAV4]|nr:hypothetical protein Ga0100231_005325 [Opitutaceae bacterium TAV4]RRK02584.1 hypothetical protein Ga0100230_005575 [Opitutaceae bacterium TAV3]